MKFQSEYETYLEHYGVKGMRWGHRKQQAKNYKDYQVTRDIQLYGKRGARKINSYMLKGDSYQTARNKMGRRSYKQAKAKKAVGAALMAIGGLNAFATFKMYDNNADLLNKKIDDHNSRIYKKVQSNRWTLNDTVKFTTEKSQIEKEKKSMTAVSIGNLVGSALSIIGGTVLVRSGQADKARYNSYK